MNTLAGLAFSRRRKESEGDSDSQQTWEHVRKTHGELGNGVLCPPHTTFATIKNDRSLGIAESLCAV